MGVSVQSNVGRLVRFDLEGVRLARRLICRPVEDLETELSVGSPVGRALQRASVGDEVEVTTPGGAIVVQLLEVSD